MTAKADDVLSMYGRARLAEAERDRLEDELRQERLRKWSTGGAMTTEEANALRQERDRYRAALEEVVNGAPDWAYMMNAAKDALEGEE